MTSRNMKREVLNGQNLKIDRAGKDNFENGRSENCDSGKEQI